MHFQLVFRIFLSKCLKTHFLVSSSVRLQQLNAVAVKYPCLTNHKIFDNRMNRIAVRSSRALVNSLVRGFASHIEKASVGGVIKRDYLQFSKNRLTEFGELPFGEIPDALKVSRPLGYQSLSNGVKVCSESWAGPLTSITVIVKAGSRNETLETSSVATFVSRLVSKGTANKSMEQLGKELDGLGGSIVTEVTREATSYTITFSHERLNQAVGFLGEILINSTFDEQQVEAEKDSIHRRTTCTKDIKTAAIEAFHYTSFRDHFLGQPVRGIRENVHNITAEQVRAFHKQNYVGNNIVVSAAGNVDINRLTELVNNTFGKLPQAASAEVANSAQPYFTPSVMFMRDDELPNTSAAVGFLAPGYTHADFYGMRLLKRIIGKYRVDKFTGAHLNSPQLQYNFYHENLAAYPDILVNEPFYFPYSDVGLFGNFIFGNEVFNNQYLFMTQVILTEFGNRIPTHEVFRARNKYWNELLNQHSSAQVSKENAYQATYLNRLVSRTEVGTKISNMDPAYISRLVNKWFWDKDHAVIASGPLHNVVVHSHYNRPHRRSTLGDYGSPAAANV